MRLTYVDSGVLIAAVRGTVEAASRALSVLADPERVFVSSVFVRLEVLPKAVYNRRIAECAFYEEHFKAVTKWSAPSEVVVALAHEEAVRHGLSAMDALHIAAASNAGAEELITVEKMGRPMHRTGLVTVRSIQP